jgi:hypothetical protein
MDSARFFSDSIFIFNWLCCLCPTFTLPQSFASVSACWVRKQVVVSFVFWFHVIMDSNSMTSYYPLFSSWWHSFERHNLEDLNPSFSFGGGAATFFGVLYFFLMRTNTTTVNFTIISSHNVAYHIQIDSTPYPISEITRSFEPPTPVERHIFDAVFDVVLGHAVQDIFSILGLPFVESIPPSLQDDLSIFLPGVQIQWRTENLTALRTFQTLIPSELLLPQHTNDT